MSRRIHTAAPVLRTCSTGTAFPPYGHKPEHHVPTMAEWQLRHRARAPFWRRLLGRARP